MEFSFIVPEAHLELASISNYHIVLPTYYIKSRRYQDFYKEMRKRGDFIILDNGFHEYKGDVMNWRGMLDLANDLEPNLFVVPELPNYDPNHILYTLSWCSYVRANISPDWEFMYTLRSMWFTEMEEELLFLKEADRDRLITWVALHKDLETLARGNLGGRRAVVLGLSELLEGYKLWMFGVYKSPVGEIRSFRGLPGVIGSDSAKPWRICSLGRLMGEHQALPTGFNFADSVDGDMVGFVEKQFRSFLDVEIKGEGSV